MYIVINNIINTNKIYSINYHSYIINEYVIFIDTLNFLGNSAKNEMTFCSDFWYKAKQFAEVFFH